MVILVIIVALVVVIAVLAVALVLLLTAPVELKLHAALNVTVLGLQ